MIDPVHERFAREVASGVTCIDAYRRARRVPSDTKVSRKSWTRLLNSPGVQERIIALQKRIAEKVTDEVAYSEEWIKGKTRDLIKEGSKLVPRRDRGGNPLVGEDGEVEMAMADSGAAAKGLDMAAKSLGLYRDKSAAVSEEENKTAAQLTAQVQSLLAELNIGLAAAVSEADKPSEGTQDPGGGTLSALPETG